MTKIYEFLKYCFTEDIKTSFLSHTLPLTRLIFGLTFFCGIFINDYMMLGIFTGFNLFLILCSLETVKQKYPLFIAPIFLGIIFWGNDFFYPGMLQAMGVSPFLLIWKLLILCLVALIFDILLPKEDVILLARKSQWPQIWAAIHAGYGAVNVTFWIVSIIKRTQKTKRIFFRKNPFVWIDTISSGLIGHAFEFLDGYCISLRTRGVESEIFLPRTGLKSMTNFDALIYFCCVTGIILIMKFG